MLFVIANRLGQVSDFHVPQANAAVLIANNDFAAGAFYGGNVSLPGADTKIYYGWCQPYMDFTKAVLGTSQTETY